MPHRTRDPIPPDAFRVIAEFTYDWETWVDDTGRTRWINPAVERITGYSVAQCLARKDYPLFLAHPSDRPKLKQVLASAAAAEAGNDVEFRVRTKAGRVRWVAVSWQAMSDHDGRALGYRTSIRDIDDRKRMERQMDRLRRKAERAAVARAELLANVSHELRSPAHCIAGFAQLLSAADLEAREQRHVRVIAEQASMMQRQVEDLLQVAALDVATLRIENAPFDLRAVLDSLVDAADLEARATQKVKVERAIALDGAWVVGDRVRIAQVVRNLLDNALKFTAEGTIRLSAVRKGANVEIDVRDTGQGMTAAQLKQVTQPFFQADSRSVRRHGGVGLGLSIVERLVHAMDGTLGIESEHHKGTRVHIVLPLSAAEPNAGTKRGVGAGMKAGVALVVDDSAVARELMMEWLRSLGWQSVPAASGKDAVKLASQRRFDVVLLDYQMPEQDGAQTALALRRLKQEPPVPIVLITANVFARDQLGSARKAIDRMLVKPISRVDLKDALTTLHTLVALAASSAPEQHTQTRGPFGQALDMRVVEDLIATPSRTASHVLAQLLPSTAQEMAQALDALDTAWADRDRDAVERASHRVAGLASTLGAKRVGDNARALMNEAARPRFAWRKHEARRITLRPLWADALAELARIAAR